MDPVHILRLVHRLWCPIFPLRPRFILRHSSTYWHAARRVHTRRCPLLDILLQGLRASFPPGTLLGSTPHNGHRRTTPSVWHFANERTARSRRMAVALPHRGMHHAVHRYLVVVHDGRITDADKEVVSQRRMVQRARGKDPGEPRHPRRSNQRRHAQ